MENTIFYTSMVNATDLENIIFYYSATENNAHDCNHTSEVCEDSSEVKIFGSIGITFIYSFFCLLGIIGNGLVLWFSIFRMKKTVNVMWFFNLAVNDFSLASSLPLTITQIALGYWPFINIMCKLTLYVQHVNLFVCILQLTVISVDRCLCVVFPVWCKNHRRPRLAFIIVLIVWIISFIVAISSIIYTDTTNSYNRTICVFKVDDISFMKRSILDFVFFFLFPFTIIVSCYIVIVLHIRGKRIVASSRPLITSVAVIIAFFICWFPSRLFFLLVLSERDKFDRYTLYYGTLSTGLLIVTSTCINPILYVFIGRDFKEKFFGSFQAKLEKAFIEEDKTVPDKQELCATLQRPYQDYTEEDKCHGMNGIP